MRRVTNILDGLLEMDWEHEVSPLVDFLNLESDFAELQQAVQDSEILKEKGGPVEDFMRLHNEIKYVLNAYYEILTEVDAKRLEKFLTRMLAKTRNRVKIIDLADKQIRVHLEASTVIQNLWADFICIFLRMDNWTKLLGKCPQCEKWFERPRKNQIYCTEGCKSKAAYTRNKDDRRLERRERYRKEKSI